MGGDLYELAKILGHSNYQDDRALREIGTRTRHQNQHHCESDLGVVEKETGSGRGLPTTCRVSDGRVSVVRLKLELFNSH